MILFSTSFPILASKSIAFPLSNLIQKSSITLSWYASGFAEYTSCRPDMVRKIPGNVSFDAACMVEPSAVSLHAVNLADIKIGDDVTFYALIENMQKRFTPNKSGYYGATLSDGDSSIDARIWDCNLVESKDITAGNVYRFTAHVNEYAGKAQYVIKSIEIVQEGEVDTSKFFKTAPLPKEALNAGIKEYLKKIKNPILVFLLSQLIFINCFVKGYIAEEVFPVPILPVIKKF